MNAIIQIDSIAAKRRQERGIIIAAHCKLHQQDGKWFVPSQSGDKRYTIDPVQSTCTCPDHQESGYKCKHLYAVEFAMKREAEQRRIDNRDKDNNLTEKETYKQNWPAYNPLRPRRNAACKCCWKTFAAIFQNGNVWKVARPQTPSGKRLRFCRWRSRSIAALSSRRFSCDFWMTPTKRAYLPADSWCQGDGVL